MTKFCQLKVYTPNTELSNYTRKKKGFMFRFIKKLKEKKQSQKLKEDLRLQENEKTLLELVEEVEEERKKFEEQILRLEKAKNEFVEQLRKELAENSDENGSDNT